HHEISELMDKDQKEYIKYANTIPSVLRTSYTYTLLWEKNEKKAEEILKQFYKSAEVYPYQGELVSEKELMVLAAESNSSYGYCVE
ncbi:MAG: hypothetical protein J6I64_01450, partial [Lachnospiraceae bacterium]|nr:hypothetical protein [Lachnospiraceae bacterium]